MARPAPSIRAERCIVFCMTCARSTTVATYVIEGPFGWLPYGRVTKRLHCRRGCGDRFGMVLPLDAPTPRAYAERYDIAADNPPPLPKTEDLEAECQYKLIEVGEGGTFLKVHAKSKAPEIVWWGFDFLLERMSKGWGKPRLEVRQGTQCSRDSTRDYKIVGGTVVKLRDDEPEADDDQE